MTTRQAPFHKKNIIITGGAGFLGSHLCDLLVQHHKVICLDDFSTGLEDNIHHLLPNPNFEFVRHDMTEPIDLTQLKELKAFQVPFQGIQEIYHLATPASPKDYTRLNIETLTANSLGTKYTLEMAHRFGAKFMLVSSGSIYGEPVQQTPFPENYWGYVDPVGVRSPYQEGKRFAEALTVAYRKRHELDTKIVRLFNTYGPRMRLTDGRMIPEFVGAALRNQPIIIHGNRDDSSSFCYVSDALEGMVRLMQSHEAGPLNIGHPEEHTVYEVAQKVIAWSGSRPDIRFEPPLEYSSKQGIPSIRQAREVLGWFPVVPLDEGLQRTIDFMRGTRQVGLETLGYGAA
ncbi:MAG: GDP-mannose 4,6-dehydratase [Candidatus Kerfeldbacteria bacterium]|nr:GDP-mannose 4,6-dehydratase [Candidatus Kerfeldbacteria bacterium]